MSTQSKNPPGAGGPTIKRRGGAFKALKVHTERQLKPVLGKRGFASVELLESWPAIVGEVIAKFSLPEHIGYPRGQRGNGTLTIRIESSALAPQVQHLEPLILDKINTFFGYKAVARLKLVHGPLPRQRTQTKAFIEDKLTREEETRLDQSVESVKSDSLKAALKKLGRAVKARNA